jgi:tetratricopeptide (TPR) repeat protein
MIETATPSVFLGEHGPHTSETARDGQEMIHLLEVREWINNRRAGEERTGKTMNAYRTTGGVVLLSVCACLGSSRVASAAPSSAESQATNEIRIVELQGQVEIIRKGSAIGVQTTLTNQLLHPFDRLRTGPRSRVALLWADHSVVPFGALTEIEILPPEVPGEQSGLHLIKGILSFFHRDKPGRIRVITRGAVAGVKGTEFVVAVQPAEDSERTRIWVIDGTVSFDNDYGSLVVTNGQSAVAEVGKPPRHTAGFIANNVLQWCFYYPAVLNPDELPLTQEETQLLGESLRAYRAGDLLEALVRFPAGRQPDSEAERIYYAALLLSVGEVQQTEDVLASLTAGEPSGRLQRLSTSLRQLIAAVKRQPSPQTALPQLSTEFLAASYHAQSRALGEVSLSQALVLARQAATNSPEFGFAWERMAELEFSFGRTDHALEALNKSLALAPRNAQALALKGFLLAAQNKTAEAIDRFNEAIAADSALANAWLGRGLCRIRRGNTLGGRQDLLVAAAIEPQRAVLRSYLGKAYADVNDSVRATKEFQLAKGLDKNDPTAWLYAALLDQQNNQINEGIRDLEKSQELNNHRAVYRSQLLLDQDRAMRSANLARIYQDAGMDDVALREASRAVNYDYANYSAHLFLANSYDQLRDPNRINLRYETPAVSEYLIANLLAPVGAGTLSPAISQQEYSKLFERDRLGLVSSTEYLSRGAWVEDATQYGTLGNTSYSVGAFYRWDPGQRRNNDFEELGLSFQFKQQVTPQDSIFLQALYYDASGGDLIQYYDQANANLGSRTKETQEPTILLGYQHEWNPGMHSLFLAGYVNDTITVDNPNQYTFLVNRTPDGLDYVQPMVAEQKYQSKPNIFSIEAQQIWETPNHTTVAGLRFQDGEIQTQNLQTVSDVNVIDFFPQGGVPAAQQDFTTDLMRVSVYGYHNWRIFDPLLLTVGLSYDWITFPKNFRAAPISNQEETEDQLSPKAGLIWTPGKNTTVRAAYTRSLSGASIDQSLTLEPAQVAGFLQSYRSIIPESVGGAEAGAQFETYGVSLEQKFPTGTYLGLAGQILKSEVDRTFGVFAINQAGTADPSSTPEQIDYKERSLLFTVDQLIGKELSIGLRYKLSYADLTDTFPEVMPNLPPDSLMPPFRASQNLSATLNQLNLHLIYNHRSGFFAQFQALWNSQNSQGYDSDIPGDDFWQFNVFVGYRTPTPRRKAEITLGVLNLTSQDYRLNPLTLYNELPRERTFMARLRFSF